MVTMSLPLFSGRLATSHRRPDVRAGADAGEDAFFLGEAARHGEGVVVGHLDALDDLRIPGAVLEVKVVRDEAGAECPGSCAGRA